MAKVPRFAEAFAGRWPIVEMDNRDSDFILDLPPTPSGSRPSGHARPGFLRQAKALASQGRFR